MSRTLFVLCFLSVLCVCFLSSSSSFVSADQFTNQLVVDIDRISATSARIRFYAAQPSAQTFTLIQYTNSSAQFQALTRTQFHACAIFSGSCPGTLTPEDREVNITQVGAIPITSYILRGLKPSTNYQVRVAYIDTATPAQVVGTAPPVDFTTPALSTTTSLTSLVASGGCGSLTSSGSLYYLTSSIESGVRVYTCNVVSETTNVTVSILPPTSYATIESSPSAGLFSKINQTLTVTASQVDPLTLYNYTIPLGAEGTTTNFSFIVTAQSGTTQTYTLSIRRVSQSSTSQLAGPSSPVTALIRSPPIPTSYLYRALLWEGTTIGPSSWKVWSDDLIVFPFSAFNITFPATTGGGAIDYTLASVQVSPAASNPVDGSCSNVYVGIFDTSSGRSSKATTCVSAIDDYCSATPFGAATKWQTYYDANGQPDTTTLYHPAPPTPGFTAA